VCGRYTLSTVDGPAIAQRFGLIAPPEVETLKRYNVCPTEPVAIATGGAERHARTVPWGIEVSRKFRPINARSETIATRPPLARFFRRAGGRVLVLADGWYEWLKSETRKGDRVPFRYTVDGGGPFAFAGVTDGTGVVILTCDANEICAPVHDRMPVVLAGPEEEAAWLDGDLGDAPDLLLPLPSARVEVAPANPAVNRAGVEGPELLVPPEPPLTLL
jgi:putative SOS response-associated peptidase YedK